MKVEFRDLTEADLEWVRDIYNFYIENSTATYYTEKIPVTELKEFIPVLHRKYKSYKIMVDHEPCGFCYISQYKKRQAYDRTAELSLYLKSEYTGKGIGKIVLEHLEKAAVNNGISVLIGIISGDNQNSIRLFEKNGYEKCAHYKQIGEKFNKILDVISYQKILQYPEEIISDEPAD
jgi:L-amino acid N-acyltransferase YncA